MKDCEVQYLYPFGEKALNALASLRLEGITLSQDTLEVLYLIEQGLMTHEEGLKSVLSRIKSKSDQAT